VPRIEIAQLLITGHVVEKLWSHGIVAQHVRAVLRGHHVVGRNRAGRAASHLLIGRDEQGRCLTIPVRPTEDPLVWRVITAWFCKPSELANLRQRRRIMEEPTRYASTQEPLDDEERELMDPDNWDWETPVDVVFAENLGIVMPIEVTFEEYGHLEQRARAEGLTPHEFMKRVALEAAQATRA
jgi:hypothetical protein